MPNAAVPEVAAVQVAAFHAVVAVVPVAALVVVVAATLVVALVVEADSLRLLRALMAISQVDAEAQMVALTVAANKIMPLFHVVTTDLMMPVAELSMVSLIMFRRVQITTLMATPT